MQAIIFIGFNEPFMTLFILILLFWFTIITEINIIKTIKKALIRHAIQKILVLHHEKIVLYHERVEKKCFFDSINIDSEICQNGTIFINTKRRLPSLFER